jgi:hypothetical protein
MYVTVAAVNLQEVTYFRLNFSSFFQLSYYVKGSMDRLGPCLLIYRPRICPERMGNVPRHSFKLAVCLSVIETDVFRIQILGVTD